MSFAEWHDLFQRLRGHHLLLLFQLLGFKLLKRVFDQKCVGQSVEHRVLVFVDLFVQHGVAHEQIRIQFSDHDGHFRPQVDLAEIGDLLMRRRVRAFRQEVLPNVVEQALSQLVFEVSDGFTGDLNLHVAIVADFKLLDLHEAELNLFVSQRVLEVKDARIKLLLAGDELGVDELHGCPDVAFKPLNRLLILRVVLTLAVAC